MLWMYNILYIPSIKSLRCMGEKVFSSSFHLKNNKQVEVITNVNSRSVFFVMILIKFKTGLTNKFK